MDRNESVRGQPSIRKTESLTLNKDGVLFEDKLKEKNLPQDDVGRLERDAARNAKRSVFGFSADSCVLGILSVNHGWSTRKHYSTHFSICQLACPPFFFHQINSPYTTVRQ